MISSLPRLAAIVLFCLCSVASAQQPEASATFHSTKGYAITPPNGWDTISAETRGQVLDTLKEKYPGLGDFDLSKIDVVFFGPTIDDFAVNLNVVTVPGVIPIRQSSVDQYSKELHNRFNSPGMSVAQMATRMDRIAQYDCIVAEYQFTMGDTKMKQWQYIVPGRSNSYIVTFSCPISAEQNFRPTVQSTMAGFVVDNPPSWWSSLPPAIRFGIIGGIIGGAAGPLISKLRKKSAA